MITRFASLRRGACCALLFVLSAAAHGDPRAAGYHIDHHEPARQMTTRPAPGDSAGEVLEFHALGRAWVLELAPNARLARLGLNHDVDVLEGRVAGESDSWVRLTRHRDSYRGLVSLRGEWFAIEPAGGVTPYAAIASSAAADATVVYRLADTRIDPGALTCATTGERVRRLMSGDRALAALQGELQRSVLDASAPAAETDGNGEGTAGNGPLPVVTLSMVGDAPFRSRFGANAEAELLGRVNIVDGIYREQIGVQFDVTSIDILDTGSDPFVDGEEINPETLLGEFGDFRAASSLADDVLSHLLTDRGLEDDTAGIAFFTPSGTLCQPRAGAALSRVSFSTMLDAAIIAHEIGHNFGAEHDNESDSVCETTPSGFIMAPSVSSSADTFSQCSIDTVSPNIAREVASGSCLQSPNADISVQAPVQGITTPVDSPFTIAVTVRSRGDREATDVRLRTVLPAFIDVRVADLNGADCEVDGQSIECALGTLPSGDTVRVEHELVGSRSGRGDAEVEADFAERVGTAPGRTVPLTITAMSAGDGTGSPPGGGGSGGGGGGSAFALTVGVLALLVWPSARRRRPASAPAAC